MVLSDVLSHDVVVPSAGCHVVLVSVRLWMMGVSGAAKTAAHNVPSKMKLYMIMFAFLMGLVTWCRYVQLAICSQSLKWSHRIPEAELNAIACEVMGSVSRATSSDLQ
jgi:hypothetical protein